MYCISSDMRQGQIKESVLALREGTARHKTAPVILFWVIHGRKLLYIPKTDVEADGADTSAKRPKSNIACIVRQASAVWPRRWPA